MIAILMYVYESEVYYTLIEHSGQLKNPEIVLLAEIFLLCDMHPDDFDKIVNLHVHESYRTI